MKIGKLFLTLTISFFSFYGFAQSTIEDYVREGITYHDNRQFDKAIETYEKALQLDPQSSLVNYEIALSYFSKGEFEKSIEYSDVVLKQDDKYLLESYITKGSSLDNLDKTKESIELFQEAIEKKGGHYLLYYNLALNYFKLDKFDEAEESVINGIASNSNHASSHYMLAAIHDHRGNSVQALLAIHYFLFLEPNSDRSLGSLQLLDNNFGRNVSQDENDPSNTNINILQNMDSEFSAAELMISMLAASNNLEKNVDKSEDELFIENTSSFFTILGELKDESYGGIWWDFYQPFYYALAKSDHLETYCKYITQRKNPESSKWLDENPDKLTNFGDWLKENYYR